MVLVCNGRAYDTAALRAFRTGDPAVPVIYLTPDGRSTFVLSRAPDGTIAAHRAGTGEIIALSKRYEIEALLGAFPAGFAPAHILPSGHLGDAKAIDRGTLLSGVGTARAGARE